MIHLDHAATGLPRRQDAVDAALRASTLANPGRGLHRAQSQAMQCVEDARQAVASLCGGGTVCFTAGTTHALNQAILGLRPAPTLVGVDPLLHNATRRPLHAVGARCVTLPSDASGCVDLGRVAAWWPDGLDLLVLTHGSNVNGVIQPVAELTELAHQRGARVVVDCAQTVGLMTPLPLGDADLVALSGHKGLRALPGVGALVVRGDVELEPLIHGGTGAEALPPAMPAAYPERLEAGSMNLPGIAGLGEAARQAGAWPWRERAQALKETLTRAGAEVLEGGALPVVSCRLPALSPADTEEMLDRVFGIVTRAGLHCAPMAHEHLGTAPMGTLRVSAGATTTQDEMDALGAAIRELNRAGEGLAGHGS